MVNMLNWGRQWQPTPVFLPGESHGWRSLVGCSPWGHEESDTTEQLHFHFSLSCIGERNGNPLQCSCLENPRDGGVWWAAVYGVAQNWTWLKRLNSSSSSFSQLFVRPPQTTILLFCISLSWGWSWLLPPVQYHEPLSIVLQALCLSDLIPWIYFSILLYNYKGFDLGHTCMV